MARVPAFQAGCCEFESRLPLHRTDSKESVLLLAEDSLSLGFVAHAVRNKRSSTLTGIRPRKARVARQR